MGGVPLAFAQPLVLLGLLSLPVLWWLLRLIPPRPRRIAFPPARLLFDIAPKEETPARTPWWLTLLRLTLAALLILAAAGPLWNPPLATQQANAPLALLVDDGWGAAAAWDTRIRTAEDLIARAEADGRGVALVPLSETGRDISLETPGAARARLRQLRPKPHTLERTEALPALARFLAATPELELIWLSDGMDLGRGAEFVDGLARLAEQRSITVVEGGLAPAHSLAAANNAANALTVKVLRAQTAAEDRGVLRALDLKGLPLGEAPFSFATQDRETEAQFDLPVEIRNDIARIEINGERSAGAVQLLDKRWRRRSIGVVTGATVETAQPLLAATYYLSRALGPFADVRLAERGSPAQAVNQFMDQQLPMLVLADVGNVAGEARERLNAWIEDGGVLVRFAGPRLAAGDDDLVPVKLRRGGRILGGSLSWEQPQQLAGFARESPFFGMAVPTDVTVTRQVLAEPDSLLGERTWAALTDGTPLVTAARRGKGLVVLFHVTADTRWSNLPLSGAFVDMLKRVVALAGSSAAAETAPAGSRAPREVVPPSRILDGFGAFGPPPPTARPAAADFSARATADHPPGFYGPPEGLLA
ncbi:MAG: LytTR family transcriptional regulator, partial [Bradyrhizobiaceae bacterium]